jgi:hypothetical protein
MVGALFHRLTTIFLLIAFVLAGCGEGYDPPENIYSPSKSDPDPQTGQQIDFEGQWQVVSLSQDGVPIDLEDSGLDVVLDISADGAVRWHVKEDGEHYYHCSADDMLIAQDSESEGLANLSYYHVVVDSQSSQVTENEGQKTTQYTVVQPSDDLIELQDGHPPRGIVMMPELNLFNEEDLVSLTLQSVAVDLSGSAPTQKYAQQCSIKTDIVESFDPDDDQPPAITLFELTSATPTTDQAIAFDLEGQDNVAVSAWLINESSDIPALDDAGWSGARPSVYTLSSGYGMKTVYAWARDAVGNISEPASLSVEYSQPPDPTDNQPPVITLFELTSATQTSDQAIAFNLEGQDNMAVSAWLINESAAIPATDDAGWSDAKPSVYTLSSDYGLKTVYAWAKDAAGNISDPASLSVEYAPPPCPSVETTFLPIWFRLQNGYLRGGNLSSLQSDDDISLELQVRDDNHPISLEIDFELSNLDVRELRISVSSLSADDDGHVGSFQRSVSVHNYSKPFEYRWDLVGESIDIGSSEEVRSDIVLTDDVNTLSDYLQPFGEIFIFRVKIELSPNPDSSPFHHIDFVQMGKCVEN